MPITLFLSFFLCLFKQWKKPSRHRYCFRNPSGVIKLFFSWAASTNWRPEDEGCPHGLSRSAVSSRLGWSDGLGNEAQYFWSVSQWNCLNREYLNSRSVFDRRQKFLGALEQRVFCKPWPAFLMNFSPAITVACANFVPDSSLNWFWHMMMSLGYLLQFKQTLNIASKMYLPKRWGAEKKKKNQQTTENVNAVNTSSFIVSVGIFVLPENQDNKQLSCYKRDSSQYVHVPPQKAEKYIGYFKQAIFIFLYPWRRTLFVLLPQLQSFFYTYYLPSTTEMPSYSHCAVLLMK